MLMEVELPCTTFAEVWQRFSISFCILTDDGWKVKDYAIILDHLSSTLTFYVAISTVYV